MIRTPFGTYTGDSWEEHCQAESNQTDALNLEVKKKEMVASKVEI